MALDSEQQAEIAAAATQQFTTKRPTVPALEERMFQPIHCLDHGFVRLIDYMGDDTAIMFQACTCVLWGRYKKCVKIAV